MSLQRFRLCSGAETTSTTQVWFNDNVSINQESYLVGIRTLTRDNLAPIKDATKASHALSLLTKCRSGI